MVFQLLTADGVAYTRQTHFQHHQAYMKTISEFVAFIKAGNKPVVTFKSGIDDKESYPEAGMRARVLEARETERDIVAIKFSYEEFDEFNKSFESSNYWDKAGQATLNAREAGYYTPQETIYFETSEKLESQFTVEETGAMQLYGEYLATGAAVSYVSWLESLVNDLRKAAQQPA